MALPHAIPDNGVLQPGMSLVRLARPVLFPGHPNDPVLLVVGVASSRASVEEVRSRLSLVLSGPVLEYLKTEGIDERSPPPLRFRAMDDDGSPREVSSLSANPSKRPRLQALRNLTRCEIGVKTSLALRTQALRNGINSDNRSLTK